MKLYINLLVFCMINLYGVAYSQEINIGEENNKRIVLLISPGTQTACNGFIFNSNTILTAGHCFSVGDILEIRYKNNNLLTQGIVSQKKDNSAVDIALVSPYDESTDFGDSYSNNAKLAINVNPTLLKKSGATAVSVWIKKNNNNLLLKKSTFMYSGGKFPSGLDLSIPLRMEFEQTGGDDVLDGISGAPVFLLDSGSYVFVGIYSGEDRIKNSNNNRIRNIITLFQDTSIFTKKVSYGDSQYDITIKGQDIIRNYEITCLKKETENFYIDNDCDNTASINFEINNNNIISTNETISIEVVDPNDMTTILGSSVYIINREDSNYKIPFSSTGLINYRGKKVIIIIRIVEEPKIYMMIQNLIIPNNIFNVDIKKSSSCGAHIFVSSSMYSKQVDVEVTPSDTTKEKYKIVADFTYKSKIDFYIPVSQGAKSISTLIKINNIYSQIEDKSLIHAKDDNSPTNVACPVRN